MSDEDDIREAEAETTTEADPDGVPPDAADTPEAPAEGEPDPKAAPAAPETPEQKAEREAGERKAQRIAAADAVEKKAAAKRAEMKKQREVHEFEQSRTRFEQERAEFAKQQAEHKERESLYERVKLGQAHPNEFFQRFGTTYADMTRQILEANTPEAIAKAAKAEAEALRKRLDDREAADARAAQTAAMQRVTANFSSYVDDQEEAFPNAFKLPEQMLHAGALRIAGEYARVNGGRSPSFEYVATKLDEEAKALQDEFERRALRARAKKPSDGAAPNPQASKTNGQANRPGSSTLTAAASSTRVTPKAVPQMTEEEEWEWGIEQLRQARRA